MISASSTVVVQEIAFLVLFECDCLLRRLESLATVFLFGEEIWVIHDVLAWDESALDNVLCGQDGNRITPLAAAVVSAEYLSDGLLLQGIIAGAGEVIFSKQLDLAS